MQRPAVDVVVPFKGEPGLLEDLRSRLSRLELREGDSITVVDNGARAHGGQAPPATGPVRTVHAPELQTPGFARNRGAERGHAGWIVFLDADVVAPPDLLERYFASPPGARTGILAGGIRDEAPDDSGSTGAVARYSHLRGSMSQEMTLRHGEWGFVQTANCALRRAAFEAVGGFREEIRAGEDADLCYRLRAAGWAMERREDAEGVHRSRSTVRALLAQKACHGAAGAWLDRSYPGSFPARRRPGLTWWGVRHAASGLWEAARRRDRDEALLAVLDPITTLSYELGRSLPNERPLPWRRR